MCIKRDNKPRLEYIQDSYVYISSLITNLEYMYTIDTCISLITNIVQNICDKHVYKTSDNTHYRPGYRTLTCRPYVVRESRFMLSGHPAIMLEPECLKESHLEVY